MLITCKECGKEISDKALFCPNCGAPGQAYANPVESSETPSSSTVSQMNNTYQTAGNNPQVDTPSQNSDAYPPLEPAYQTSDMNMQMYPSYESSQPQPVIQLPKKYHPIGGFFAASSPFFIATVVQLLITLIAFLGFFSAAAVDPMYTYEGMSDIVAERAQDAVPVILIISQIFSLSIFLPWYYFTWGKKRGGYPRDTVEVRDIAMVIVVSLGFQLAFTSCLDIIDIISPSALDSYKELLENSGITQGSFASVFSTVLLAPIVEELAFRGVSFELSKKMSKYILVGIIVQAFFFGLSHLNWVQGIFTFIIALFWGYISYTHDCIWISIIGHMALNASAYLLKPVFFMATLLGPFVDFLYILLGAGLIIWGILHYCKRDFA